MIVPIAQAFRRFALLSLPILFSSLSYAVVVPVRVVDGTGAGIQNARVYAVHFGDHGPDGALSQMANATDSNGYAYLTLADNVNFELLADVQGYGPTLRSQMFNPEHARVFTSSTDMSTRTITLGETLTSKAIITANVSNASPNSMLFGNVRKIAAGSDVAFGACATDGSGVCVMTFSNIPPLSTLSNGNSYDVSAFDPANGENGKGNGGQIAGIVAAPNTYPINIDINNGLPPDLSANEGGKTSQGPQGQNGPGGVLAVEGVVEDFSYSTVTVPFTGLSLRVLDQGGVNKQDRFGTGVDQNGRFQIFTTLELGTTYFIRSFGGCRPDGRCYEGYETTSSTPDFTRGDFVYDSSTSVKVIHVRLKQAAPGSGRIAVYVKDSNGNGLPGTNINVWPDSSQWHTDPSITPLCSGMWDPVNISSPGFANKNLQTATGYALVDGLRPGNYVIQAFSQFGNNSSVPFNAGADADWSWGPKDGPGGNGLRGCFQGSEDDLRLTVEADNSVNIYNASGTIVAHGNNISSITITIPLEASGAGHMVGTLSFPEIVDLSADPITIVLRGGCGPNGCSGNFVTIGDNEAPAASYNFDIQVSTFQVMYDENRNPTGTSPAQYYPEIVSNYWGRIQENHEQDQIEFKEGGSNTITKDFKFAKAGRIIGKLYKPDGSIFQPSQTAEGYMGANINARGVTGHSWANTQILQDGSFIMGGLTPGEYQLIPQAHGGDTASYSSPDPLPKVIVTANADTYKDLRFVSGEVITFAVSFAGLPPLNRVIDTSHGGSGFYRGENWEMYRFPAGFAFTPENLGKILTHELEENTAQESPSYGNTFGPCGQGPWPGGFCPQQVPTNTAYDFYMVRSGNIEGGNYQYNTFITSRKNVPVDANHHSTDTVSFNGSNVNPVAVGLNPGTVSIGATVKGTVVAKELFRPGDFKALGGSFSNFIKYIPVVALYSADGQLKAAGLVTPPPALIDGPGGEAIDQAVADNDYEAFKSLVGDQTWGYEIRGIPAGQTFNFVGTTPNYPPFTKVIQFGVAGSTVTLDINWDEEVGAGATITGVVKSTDNVNIANAQVEIGVKGAKSKVLVTETDGVYKAEGLPLGKYKIKVTADGFAPSSELVDATEFSTTTMNFTLTAAGGSIAGTVKELVLTSRGPVIKPVSGATILAYDDTENVNDPTKPLALYKTETSSTGAYSLLNVIPGDVYKIFALAPGRYIQSVSTTAASGEITGVDIDLKQKPLQVEVFARPNSPNYEFSILNPNNFESGKVYWEDADGGFDINVSSEISDSFTNLPDGSLLGSIPLSALDASKSYILHIVATPASGEADVIKEITFGLNVDGNTEQPIDNKLIGDDTLDDSGRKNNEISLGEGGGSNAGIELPTGSLIQTSTADVPTITLTQSSTDSLSGAEGNFDGTFTGDVFNIVFSSVQFTGRDIVFNLGYDANAAGENLPDLKVFHFNPNSNSWAVLAGQVTIDPVTGLVSVSANPNNLAGFQQPLNNAPFGEQRVQSAAPRGMQAASTAKQFLVNAQANSSGSGAFVVGFAASTTGVSSGGNVYRQYNFPNPFNLKPKTVVYRAGTSGAPNPVDGTIITVTPTGSGTCTIKIRIYNVVGELVRELVKDDALAGHYNYIEWDGRNTAGNEVASGVYLAKVDAPGAPKRDPIKLVVVK